LEGVGGSNMTHPKIGNPFAPIKDLVKQKLAKKGMNFTQLAFAIKVRYPYLMDVLSGRRISRKVVKEVADYLESPEIYEEYERISRLFDR